jgi:hypothetical protein
VRTGRRQIYSAPGRALVPSSRPVPGERLANPLEQWTEQQSKVRPLPPGVRPAVDIRDVSPRQMADMSMDLYASGLVSWEEYSELAFQAELHPDFDRTVGALTGERAMPNRRRDFVAVWVERLAFEIKYNAHRPKRIERARHIVNVFRQISKTQTDKHEADKQVSGESVRTLARMMA